MSAIVLLRFAGRCPAILENVNLGFRRRLVHCAGVFVIVALNVLAQQQSFKPFDPAKAKTHYSFPLRSGQKPFRFEIQFDRSSTITGVAVYQFEQSEPFQVLPACKGEGVLTMQLTRYDDEKELLKHQDLNLDGYQDVELLQYYVPHLGKSLFCNYVWNVKEDRFTAAPDIPHIDPVVHSETRTLSVHEDFQGGDVFIDSVYKWSGSRWVLISQSGREDGSDDPGCASTDFCRELKHKKLVETDSRSVDCGSTPDRPLVCPAVKVKLKGIR